MVFETSQLASILGDLKSSPLFNLSLTNKELFHSNFLAWLCEMYPAEVGALFADFLPHPDTSVAILKVYRELHNIDLTLEYSNGDTLILENKVKSLPYLAQLEGYAAAVQDKSRVGFLLLSLTEPHFLDKTSPSIKLKDGTTWGFLSYAALATRLDGLQAEVAAKNHYHGQLLQDYLVFIRGLDRVQHVFQIKPDDDTSDFFGNYQDIEQLNYLRLADFVYKLRYAQLALGVAQNLEQEGFEVLIGGGSWWAGKAGQVSVSSDMSRGVGFFDLKYIVTTTNPSTALAMLGIQLQGNAFRLVFEYHGDKSKALKIAEALFIPNNGKKLWFDLSLIKDNRVEYPKKRSFNQYSGTFLYRYKPLNARSPKALIELIIDYAKLMRENSALVESEVIQAH